MTTLSTTSQLHSVICSFCSQLLKVPGGLLGKQTKCPKCNHLLWLVAANNGDICGELTTYWYYSQPKMLVGREEHGPIADDHFLELIAAKIITHRSDVRSPEWTNDEWFPLEHIKLPLVSHRVTQRKAEQRRLAEIEARKRQLESDKRVKLRKLIREAIADGELSSREKESIAAFAMNVGVADEEVSGLLAKESSSLISDALEEALEDGVLEPAEERRIGEAAKHLGCPIKVTDEQRKRIELCRFAYQLNTREIPEVVKARTLLSLPANESCFGEYPCEWLEVVQSKKPVGKRIDGDKYLKPVLSGTSYITNKHILLVTSLESRKARISSVQSISIYTDGLFLNRSTGKSVFLRFLEESDGRWQFGLLTTRVVTDEPVQGILPNSCFPVLDDASEDLGDAFRSQGFFDEPRFTFRIVGDHIGNRSNLISRLQVGDSICLVREPTNPYDRNAVLVMNSSGEALGYLKREVAEWFAPLLDSGRIFSAVAYRIHDDGRLIAGVYETR